MHKYKIKDIEGYEGLYKVDTNGDVWTKLKASPRSSGGWEGYKVVTLYSNGKARSTPIHRVVAKAFIRKSKERTCVNHINNFKDDNRASNLEWCTQAENIRHAQKQGRMAPGKSVPIKRLDEAGVKIFPSINQAAKSIRKHHGNISRCFKGRDWGYAYGYRWEKLTASSS